MIMITLVRDGSAKQQRVGLGRAGVAGGYVPGRVGGVCMLG